ncbi:aladin-like [Eriocheir sinensis]|uniref:aladin-like n=1 Tax=Eriocheir sinensis TaxID=95602 RepID=UPI0021C75A34|nr:aladin-like [Eriocheir sinensis]
MISLDHLPPPPPLGQVTAYENDGRLCARGGPEATTTARKWLGEERYIEVAVGQEPVRSAHSKQEARDAFYAHKETPWQRIMCAYYEEGWGAALQEAVRCEAGGGRLQRAVVLVAAVGVKVAGLLTRLQALLPSPAKSPAVSAAPLVQRGGGGSITSVCWHPHTNTHWAWFMSEAVRLFMAGHSVAPFLKHRHQRGLTQVAWMPLSAGVLAIGCESGVQLWVLDPNTVVGRPSGSCATLLTHPAVTPVAALTWHPKGNLLACVGGGGSRVVVWDVWREVAVVVHGGGAGGAATQVLWSPDGSRLLVTYAGKTMRIFETQRWTYEQWSLESPVQSAVWSGQGHVLLFVTQADPTLYCLTFVPGEGVGGTQVAAQVADLTQIIVTCKDGEEMSVGGAVRQLAWDPRSERLAVVFRDTECVALLHTHPYPSLHLAPGGFIRGEAFQVPVSVNFQQNLSTGAVLSVVWTSGQVSHIPMRYSSRDEPHPATTPANTSTTTSPLHHHHHHLQHHHHHQLASTFTSLPHSGYFSEISPASPPFTSPPFTSPITSPILARQFASPQ